jgi:putative proteasome-type protease
MTYCVATMIDAGIVFASDSRTNAGVDNISTFRKMKIFERPGDRALIIINSATWR